MTEEQRIKHREAVKKYYEKNREKVLQRHRKYNEKNKDKNKEYGRKYNELNKEKRQKWKDENKDRLKIHRDKWYNLNKEERHKSMKIWRESNREKRKVLMEKWRTENKKYVREYSRKYNNDRRKNNVLVKLAHSISNSIRTSIKKGGYTKTSKTNTILGTDYKTFKEYLEGLWEPWMSWDNYGLYKKDTFNYGWDIDHIIPTCTAKTEEEVLKLNHYTNLKPLCSKVNRDIKRDKV